jgi:hypothetical protein
MVKFSVILLLLQRNFLEKYEHLLLHKIYIFRDLNYVPQEIGSVIRNASSALCEDMWCTSNHISRQLLYRWIHYVTEKTVLTNKLERDIQYNTCNDKLMYRKKLCSELNMVYMHKRKTEYRWTENQYKNKFCSYRDQINISIKLSHETIISLL